MLSIQRLQVRAESLPLLKHVLRLLQLVLDLLSKLVDLSLKLILLFGLKIISLPVFQTEAPEIDLADIE
ncbi:MAG: hypothetical protein PVG97_01235 [Syntrophobacterales bacterium]|jgi:hypothetical protein